LKILLVKLVLMSEHMMILEETGSTIPKAIIKLMELQCDGVSKKTIKGPPIRITVVSRKTVEGTPIPIQTTLHLKDMFQRTRVGNHRGIHMNARGHREGLKLDR